LENVEVSPNESVSVAVINVVEEATDVEALKVNDCVPVVVGVTVL
jgi:hypothetical protein